MNKITCIENYINYSKEDTSQFSCFIIEPLEIGQGITLGNSLRRTLLSELSGYTITGVRLNNLKHEFENSNSLREDTLEILLNLKEILFKGPYHIKNDMLKSKVTFTLNIKGPAIITAGLLNATINKSNDIIQIINPSAYICTITDKSLFYLELDIEKNKGYVLNENNKFEDIKNILHPLKPNTLLIDSIYMPIVNVNYKIKIINDIKGHIKESLHLNIITNGTISPHRCLKEALKILLNVLIPLFLDTEFLNLYAELLSVYDFEN